MKAISHIVHKKDQPLAQSRNGFASKPDVMILFQENLSAIREYYRQKPGGGVEMGHLVLLELCMSDVISALSAANEGKAWQPPSV